MMIIRASEQRGHFKNEWLESAHTFSFGSYYDSDHLQFGPLRVINHDQVQPSSGFDFHAHRDMEIFTYMLKGVLVHQDSMKNRKEIRAAEVQVMSAGTGILHSEMNSSRTELAEFLQIWIFPQSYGLKPQYQQRTFSRQDKLNQFRLILSPEGDRGSLKIHQKAWVWASVLEKEVEREFVMEKGPLLWLQVASGEIEVENHRLKKGDGLRVENPSRLRIKGVSLESEFLLIEMSES
jgi:redox-sensitive bicupin YhaK (pirin superfamily)